MTLTPPVLARCLEALRPGTTAVVGGRVSVVLGTILCTDDDESWLECYLDQDGERRWLAVEVRAGADGVGDDVLYTVWQRAPAVMTGLRVDAATLDGVPLTVTERGFARFSAIGHFEPFVIPDSGWMGFVEFVDGSGRVAAARFDPRQPWLAGTGTGEPVAVETGTPAT